MVTIVSLIENEIDSAVFKKKQNKFIHNIDTFYYSIKLDGDFTVDSVDSKVIRFREFLKTYDNLDYGSFESFVVPELPYVFNFMPFRFAGYYKYCLECPDMFDIFFAEVVPKSQDGVSVTSEVIVQLRSCPLWCMGVIPTFELSYKVVKYVLDMFNIEILEVKENRVDYCWHSNYLQNPSQFFRIDNFAQMQVSRFKRVSYQYQVKPCDEYENDYICLGKRSDKVFVRIYLKSKEVVEMGYKPWFISIWHEQGMISDYDKYLYEECYKRKSWNYVDIARLNYYLLWGKDEMYKLKCQAVIDNPENYSDNTIHHLADFLTPRITLITNVEYQTTRKSSKSYNLLKLKDNSKYGVCERIYTYMDNRKLITEYLTHDTLRLVSRTGDTNKSRCDYCMFWKMLRSCRMIDVCCTTPKHLKLTRIYTRNLNKELVKHRMLHGAVTYSLYVNGLNDNDVIHDCAAALLRLNDNDIHNMKQYKEKKKRLLNRADFSSVIEDNRPSYIVVSESDGEMYEGL